MHVQSNPIKCGIASIFLLAMTFVLGGCMTEYEPGQEPLPPKPRSVPNQPSGVSVDTVQIFPQLYPRDTDADGWGDEIQVMLYLWASQSSFAYPIHDDRDITFSLYVSGQVSNPDSSPITLWSFDASSMKERRVKTVVGNAYYFTLTLDPHLLPQDEDGRVRVADLLARIRTRSGDMIRSGVSTIRLRSGGR